MRTLFLDIASHTATIACVVDTEMYAVSHIEGRVADHDLLPLVEQTLEIAGTSYNALDRLACVIGPGGFTSLRIAVTFANVLADQCTIPSAGVHLSDFLLSRLPEQQAVYWLHSTRKDQLFVRGGDIAEPTLFLLEDWVSLLHQSPQPLLWCGELLPAHRAFMSSDAVSLAPLQDSLPQFLNTLTYTSEELRPWYGRGW